MEIHGAWEEDWSRKQFWEYYFGGISRQTRKLLEFWNTTSTATANQVIFFYRHSKSDWWTGHFLDAETLAHVTRFSPGEFQILPWSYQDPNFEVFIGCSGKFPNHQGHLTSQVKRVPAEMNNVFSSAFWHRSQTGHWSFTTTALFRYQYLQE